jgi:hypothetical protein
MADTASFLCRDEDEVRQKAKELRLVEHPRGAALQLAYVEAALVAAAFAAGGPASRSHLAPVQAVLPACDRGETWPIAI